jgi:hypothetical protein
LGGVHTINAEGSIVQSLARNVERRLVETPLPTPAVILADIVAMNIASAVLALLAA